MLTGSALPKRALLLAFAVAGLLPRQARAQAAPTPTPEQTMQPATAGEPAPEIWAVHEQGTFETQYHPAFSSALHGTNSLDPGSRGNETFDATLFAGVRPWAHGELWVNPEIDQGFGLSGTLGVAAFPSAEAYKVGAAFPYLRLQRLFFRQTMDLGGAPVEVRPDLNVLGDHQTENRLVITIGKFSVPDVFDTNSYAHDSKQDFSNWGLVDTGTFDYAADAWGYSYGVAAEWYQDWWAMRAGAFALSRVPNSAALDTSGGQFQIIGEGEARHDVWGQAGKVKITGYMTRGRMGDYGAAILLGVASGTAPNVGAVRQYRSRTGLGVSLEQAITPTLGLFARAGFNEGGREPYEFTDTDRSFAVGVSLQGKYWGRPDDTVGLATVIDGISHRHKDYLAAGGLGILIGDGALPRSGPEQVLETYYKYALASFAYLTADYQFINNPGYDRARGPISVLGARLHIQY